MLLKHKINVRKLISECFFFFFKYDFSKEQGSSLKMILGSKHVGAILNVLMKKNYVCALVGVLIKWLRNAWCNDEGSEYSE